MGVKISNSGVEMGNLIGKSSIGLFKLSTSAFTDMEGIGQAGDLSSCCVELVTEVRDCGVEVGDLVCKSSIGLLKLGASGFPVIIGNLQVVEFNS